MPLPICVKVDQSARCVGRLETWCGPKPPCAKETESRLCAGYELHDMAKDIHWTGRLWRDPEIPKSVAMAETLRYIDEADGIKLRHHQNGFGLFAPEGDRIRILLIGVRIDCRRRGVARDLIAEAGRCFSEIPDVIAGTYHDNHAAQRLYMGLGMKIIKTELVYHQNG